MNLKTKRLKQIRSEVYRAYNSLYSEYIRNYLPSRINYLVEEDIHHKLCLLKNLEFHYRDDIEPIKNKTSEKYKKAIKILKKYGSARYSQNFSSYIRV